MQLKKLNSSLQWVKQILTGRFFIIAIPYTWMVVFFLLPFIVIFRYSLVERVGRKLGEYSDIITYNAQKFILLIDIRLSNYEKLISFPGANETTSSWFQNISDLIHSNLYWLSYLESAKIAIISTILCLALAYPFSWAISRCKSSTRSLLLLLVVLPSWTAFLIRIYAWQAILNNQTGILNQFLIWIGAINEPLAILNTEIAVYIGIVYCYLPFAILPIYASISKIDNTLVEAAQDLGCKPFTTFFKVILPLTKSGVISGGMLVFIPALGEYVIPELLGGSNSLMIGKRLVDVFNSRANWPMASALAVVMLIILVIPIIYFNKLQNQSKEK